MSALNPNITNDLVIPSVQSRLFLGNQAARFAVGMIAHGETIMPGMSAEYLGYLRLRANVYADQTNMIPKDVVAADGTEKDIDDPRSVHFAVVENGGKNKRVVAAMRLIIKSDADPRALPIEEFFAEEAFADGPAPLGSTEVSRYICRHEDPKIERQLKWPLYTAALTYVMDNNIGPTYAVVEEFLEKGLKKTGVPITRIAPPKFVPEYNDFNMGIEIDTDLLGQLLSISPREASARQESTNVFTYYNNDIFIPIQPVPEQAQVG